MSAPFQFPVLGFHDFWKGCEGQTTHQFENAGTNQLRKPKNGKSERGHDNYCTRATHRENVICNLRLGSKHAATICEGGGGKDDARNLHHCKLQLADFAPGTTEPRYIGMQIWSTVVRDGIIPPLPSTRPQQASPPPRAPSPHPPQPRPRPQKWQLRSYGLRPQKARWSLQTIESTWFGG